MSVANVRIGVVLLGKLLGARGSPALIDGQGQRVASSRGGDQEPPHPPSCRSLSRVGGLNAVARMARMRWVQPPSSAAVEVADGVRLRLTAT
ncbi:MAG: hypothetical protein M3460_16765, partial [Actinomycetota bacterium]|nr:hypothetical protein [Actinomycetota bacterium]